MLHGRRRPHHIANVAAAPQPLNYNSVEWSQAANGDPLVCVTGSSQIKVLNVMTGALVTVRPCVSKTSLVLTKL
jgi:hypothetical protein